MILLISLTVATAAFIAMALAMSRHWQQATAAGSANPYRRVARGSGWLLLSLSLAIALRGHRWTIALVEWLGVISLAGCFVALLFTFLPRRATQFALGSLAIAVLLALGV